MDDRRDVLRSDQVRRCRPQGSPVSRTDRAVPEGTRSPQECYREDHRDHCRGRTADVALPHVSGMICISPMAPFGDLARTSPALSTPMTVRIQRSGTPKRREACSTKSANGSPVAYLAGGFAGCGSATAGTLLTVSAASNGTTASRLLSNKRKRAAVLAPVQGKAASRRPFGRPGPLLCASALQALVGTWGNRGEHSLLGSPH